MIMHYPIIKSLDLLSNLPAPDVEPPLKFYTHEAAEDNAWCFQELKCIVQVTKAEVYIYEFNVHSDKANHNMYSGDFEPTVEYLMKKSSITKLPNSSILLVLAVVPLAASILAMTRATILRCL